jgi:transcription-repair coupling factor (superfamily II helicase)
MDDLKAQIDAVGVSAPVKTPILPSELVPVDVPSHAPPNAAAVGFSSEQWTQWQEMMDELRDRMDAWTQHMSAATSSDLHADSPQVWREVQATVSAQGQQLETMMSQMNSLAAQTEVQALVEQLAQWRTTSEQSLQLELQKAPQVEAKLVVHQNEQMQALGQLQQELRAFALAGAQSSGRLMAIEQAVTQLQARLGVEPGHAVPPAAPQRVLSAPPPPLEKVERVTPKTPPKWANGLMVGAIAVLAFMATVGGTILAARLK